MGLFVGGTAVVGGGGAGVEGFSVADSPVDAAIVDDVPVEAVSWGSEDDSFTALSEVSEVSLLGSRGGDEIDNVDKVGGEDIVE